MSSREESRIAETLAIISLHDLEIFMAGNSLGPRKAYVYTTDDGKTTILLLDETIATLTGTGLVPYTNQVPDLPKTYRFTPRIVYWESDDKTLRKRITCGTASAALYAKTVSAPLTIDGTAGYTTGRVGEKVSYLRGSAIIPI